MDNIDNIGIPFDLFRSVASTKLDRLGGINYNEQVLVGGWATPLKNISQVNWDD